jgi:tryptophanyl-tRNA synthetase
LGHWVGSLRNRVELQYKYETILIIADLHVLTTKKTRADIREILEMVWELETLYRDGKVGDSRVKEELAGH